MKSKQGPLLILKRPTRLNHPGKLLGHPALGTLPPRLPPPQGRPNNSCHECMSHCQPPSCFPRVGFCARNQAATAQAAWHAASRVHVRGLAARRRRGLGRRALCLLLPLALKELLQPGAKGSRLRTEEIQAWRGQQKPHSLAGPDMTRPFEDIQLKLDRTNHQTSKEIRGTGG